MSDNKTRDLTGLTEDQIDEVDAFLEKYGVVPLGVETEELGTLIAWLDAGEGYVKIDVTSPVWERLGRIGQIDVLSDWLATLGKMHDSLFSERSGEEAPAE